MLKTELDMVCSLTMYTGFTKMFFVLQIHDFIVHA